MTRLVGLNEHGLPVGETHHRARVPDLVVNRIRELHEEENLGYRRIAKLVGLSRSFVRKICLYQRRAQFPTQWKRVEAACR